MKISIHQYKPGEFIIVKNSRPVESDGITGTRSRGPATESWDGAWSGNSWVGTAHFTMKFSDGDAARAYLAENEETMRQAP